jgi:hypothetical protein
VCGRPFVLPISDGVFPLGLFAFFGVFILDLLYLPDEVLEDIVELGAGKL